MATFLQAHFLTSYAASLLNRDDAGFAKRIDFGGHTRLRVSSQCLKRAWREALMKLDDASFPTALRSCSVFQDKVLPALVAEGIAQQRAEDALKAVIETVIKGASGGKGKGKEKENGQEKKGALITSQPILLGQREKDALVSTLAKALKKPGKPADIVAGIFKGGEAKKTLSELLGLNDPLAYGVETAMFGRFVTSDVLARTDSSVSVAHAMTVHTAAPELDFFAVVDDLSPNTGADFVGEAELSAGLYYTYLAVDLAGLTSNLTGCDPKAWATQDLPSVKAVIEKLLTLAACHSPGAKKGPTAPYARTDFALLEVGESEPRQLANAFLKPMRSGDEDLMTASVKTLVDYLGRLDRMYPCKDLRYAASTCQVQAPNITTCGSFQDAVDKALDVIKPVFSKP